MEYHINSAEMSINDIRLGMSVEDLKKMIPELYFETKHVAKGEGKVILIINEIVQYIDIEVNDKPTYFDGEKINNPLSLLDKGYLYLTFPEIYVILHPKLGFKFFYTYDNVLRSVAVCVETFIHRRTARPFTTKELEKDAKKLINLHYMDKIIVRETSINDIKLGMSLDEARQLMLPEMRLKHENGVVTSIIMPGLANTNIEVLYDFDGTLLPINHYEQLYDYDFKSTTITVTPYCILLQTSKTVYLLYNENDVLNKVVVSTNETMELHEIHKT